MRNRFPDLSNEPTENILTAKFNDRLPQHFKLQILNQNDKIFQKYLEADSVFQDLLMHLNPNLDPHTLIADITSNFLNSYATFNSNFSCNTK